MALLTLEGVYEDGRVALAEQPEGVERARVVVTFLPPEGEGDTQTNDEAEQSRREAISQLMADMKRGLDFGGEKFNREEMYEERLRELDRRRGLGDD